MSIFVTMPRVVAYYLVNLAGETELFTGSLTAENIANTKAVLRADPLKTAVSPMRTWFNQFADWLKKKHQEQGSFSIGCESSDSVDFDIEEIIANFVHNPEGLCIMSETVIVIEGNTAKMKVGGGEFRQIFPLPE
ncbi:MAG: hypothetical protein OXR68_06970 [Alphaproteobacteria bacterium]|nr:hypothetical protein [Alphaproteobacteria bacterium]